jgi:hypothetical protein
MACNTHFEEYQVVSEGLADVVVKQAALVVLAKHRKWG